jgi:cytochrome P450
VLTPMHSFDIMADLTFGESMGLLEAQEYSPWLQGIFDGIFYACVSRAFQYFPALWNVVQLFIPRSIHEAAEASVKHSADRVDKRLAMDTERPDIFGLVLKHETGSKMPRREMHANADLLMIAGTETTATMLSGLTYNLLTNPGPMEKLTREIRESFQSADEITIDALPKLPVGRPHPITPRALLKDPVPVRLPRRGSPNVPVRWRRRAPQDKRHGRNHLRTLRSAKRKQYRSQVSSATRLTPQLQQVGVSVPHFAAYRSSYNFTDGDSFIPERWLAAGSQGFDPRFADDKRKVLQPFSTGPRNCLGMK